MWATIPIHTTTVSATTVRKNRMGIKVERNRS